VPDQWPPRLTPNPNPRHAGLAHVGRTLAWLHTSRPSLAEPNRLTLTAHHLLQWAVEYHHLSLRQVVTIAPNRRRPLRDTSLALRTHIYGGDT